MISRLGTVFRTGVTPFTYQAVIFAYCMLNLCFFGMVQPYVPAGDELLVNGGFSQGLRNWQLHGDADRISLQRGVLTITHPVQDSTVLSQCWKAQQLPRPLLLAADGMSQGVVRGDLPWEESRIDLVGYDDQGQGFYHVRTRLFGLQGDRHWVSKQALFQIPQESKRICLEIIHFAVPGVFKVRNISLTRGEASRYFQLGQPLLLAGWIALLAWLVRPLFQHYGNRSLGAGLVIVVVLLLVGVLIPHDMRQRMEAAIVQVLVAVNLNQTVSAVNPEQSVWALWPAQWGLSKSAHLLGFAVLSIMLSLDRQTRLVLSIGALLLLSLASEVLQFYVPLRTPRLSDFMIDGLGILIGLGVASVVAWARSRLLRNR